jgi:hypothetical protein
VNTRPHIGDRDLLFIADGEHKGRRENEMRDHLRACWDCRTRMSEMEAAIEAFVGARRHLFEHKLQDPRLRTHTASREELTRRVHAVLAAESWTSPLARWIGGRRFPSTVATLIVIGALAVFQMQHFTLEATELIEKASLWESNQAVSVDRALHRRFSLVERAGNARPRRRFVEVWKNTRTRTKVSVLMDEKGARLETARIDSQLPGLSLSNAWEFEPAAETFAAVAGSLGNAHVTREASGFLLSAPKIDLVLERQTYRPTRETLRVGEAEFEFSESAAATVTEMPKPEAVAPVLSADTTLPPLPEPSLARPAAASQPADAEELNAIEVSVRVGLHRLQADLGEAIRIERREQEIEIAGVVDSRSRKDQILRAFSGTVHVRVSLLSPEDAGQDGLLQALQTAPAIAEPRHPLLESWLDLHFPDRSEQQKWVKSALSQTTICLERAHAIADLDARYGANLPPGIVPLRDDHRVALRNTWTQLVNTLAPILGSDISPAGPSSTTRTLLEDIRDFQRDLSVLLAGNQSEQMVSQSTDELIENARARTLAIGPKILVLTER